MTTLLPTQNLSFYTIPLAYILALAPHIYAVTLYESSSKKKFDMRHPRGMTSKLSQDQSIDNATKDTILRAESAQANGMENISLFAAAVVAGNMAHVSTSYLNGLSIAYVVSRAVYNVLYITNTTAGMAQARSVVFFVGVGCMMGLFIGAGNKLF